MKNLLCLALIFVTFLGCKEDKEFKTPSFEGTKNNVRWSADGQIGFNSIDGSFNIKGEIGAESVVLNVPSKAVGTYIISSTSDSYATFTDLDGTFYSTQNEPDEDLTVYPVGGTIIIDALEGTTVSGRFQFSAFTDDGLQGITFSGDANRDNDTTRYGVFYRVDASLAVLASNDTTNPQICIDAAQTSDDAEVAFNAVTPADPTYPTVCTTYKNALQDEITACGDPGGLIQAEIDALGTCM